ncbi:MAG TPA: hypothetical protein VLY23_17380 [Candidatus Acidoferrum sp.]|nr:hypothetical protein [Candidatus Acidoferrum sp.]
MAVLLLQATALPKAPGTFTEVTVAMVLCRRFETTFLSSAEILSGDAQTASIPSTSLQAIRIPFAELISALKVVGDEATAVTLHNAIQVFGAAKNFRPPPHLGDVQAQFCYVVLLRAGSDLDFSKYLKGDPVSHLGRDPIVTWRLPSTESKPAGTDLFEIEIAHSAILISNSLDDLRETAHQLEDSEKTSVPNLPEEWNQLDKYDFWGYRAYVEPAPENRTAAGMSDIGPGAKALTLVLNLHSQTCVLRLIGNPELETSATKLTLSEGFPPFAHISNGVWGTEIPLKKDGSDEAVFGAMALFGFGTYL